MLVCFLAILGIAGLGLVKQTVKSKLQQQIQRLLDDRLSGSGLAAEIGLAVWNEGYGLSVNNVSLTLVDGSDRRPFVFIKHVFIKSPFQLTDLVSHWPRIEEVVIEGMMTRGARGPGGDWNLADAGERISRLCQNRDPLTLDFPIHIRDSSVELQPDLQAQTSPLRVSGLNLDYQRGSAELAGGQVVDEVTGEFGSEMSGPVQFRASLNRTSQQWRAAANIARLQLGGPVNELIARLWPAWSDMIRQTDGRVGLQAEATGAMDDLAASEYRITGQVDNLQCLSHRLPHPVHQGKFRFQLDNQGLQVTGLQCQAGYGTLSGSFRIPDWTASADWQLDVTASGIELTERMLAWLPQRLQSVWHQYQPAGIVAGTFQFVSRQGQLHKTIRSTISEGSLSFDRFPFRLNHCSGTINVDDRVLTLSGSAIEAQQLIKFQANILDPGPDWTGWVAGECQGDIPINEKLLQAFRVNPELEQTLRNFNSTGNVSGWGRVERRDPRMQQPRYHYEIDVRQASIRYESFSWPIYNVHGRVTVDNDRTVFQGVSGTNRNGEITCNGTWTRSGQLNLFFLAQSVALDDELRQALSPDLQKFWRELRPSGTVDRVDLDLTWDSRVGELNIDLEAEIETAVADQPGTVACKPIWFPYELRQVSGKFRFHDQQFEIRNLTGRHGRTVVSCDGTGFWDQQQWRVQLANLVASNVILDRDLLAALPTPLVDGLEAIRFDGQVSLRGSIDVNGSNEYAGISEPEQTAEVYQYVTTFDPAGQFSLGWDLDVGVGQASCHLGLPIQHANGIISSRGHYQNGVVVSLGELSIDSMMYRDIQVTDIRGPLLIDNHRVAIGSLAKSPRMQTPPPSVRARVFDGDVLCDGQLLLEGDGQFFVQATLANAQLQVIAEEVSGNRHDIAGATDAGIRLAGDATGYHSINGNGFVQLKNAQIYKLPVILALLNVLRIQEPDFTAFDAGQIEFSILGEDIELSTIELNGNAISLIGNGRMNLDSKIDLDFYTVMGRNRFVIPVITPLFKAGSQQILWIEVEGTLDNPKTVNKVLPGLNDSLRVLFPELEQQQGNSGPR